MVLSLVKSVDWELDLGDLLLPEGKQIWSPVCIF